ncbi:MAG: hypothetical protein A2289_17150 [Deltaproteobacteria bacterium RIFOXYA12_FULL_58_15]|nr:MAG: hypothetical protein A2289_17150 [Deltaproteobacteria bacterium RIFOXYA12_FULL_58_15]OGR12899.1 MAG: hypothetical protein A2341_23370 [Deltaproteobacteria bacterium RIFOXYB12_FULL_58_9]
MLVRVIGIAAVVMFSALKTNAMENRYALLVGANHGDSGETPLRYALDDIQRMGETLRRLGGFLPDNMVILEEPSADRVRDALARLNARIRSEQSAQTNTLLMVFYSGHADALSLHLKGTHLPWDELRNQTAGSSATARILVVDACRSGQATRVKGTKLTEPFALPALDAPAPEGFAVLSSTTAGESAQESDELGSSFFTHHFLAALHGVADDNEDGNVTLAEAFQYASDRTVASTASTMAGLQHPTYFYDLKGRADLVLSRPGQGEKLGGLKLSGSGQYLIRENGPHGALALEANIRNEPRTAWLKPGRYFIQRRLPERFFEGHVTLKDVGVIDLAQIDMRTIEYAQLARKGGQVRKAFSVGMWAGAETPVLPGFSFPWTTKASFAWDMSAVTLDANLALMRSGHDGEALDSTLTGIAAAIGARKVFDVGAFALSGGLKIGGVYFDQRYSGKRLAPPRKRLAPIVDALVRSDVHLPWGFFVGLESTLRVSYLRQKTGLFSVEARTPVQGIFLAGIGKSW